MHRTFQQSTGELREDGNLIATGYSGHDTGLNNPTLEWQHDVGPIPRGLWDIGPAHTHADKGPVVMTLTPVGHNACGRSGFLIHGDNGFLNHTASHGCIILARVTREHIAASDDRRIEVVA